jgi:hypothetical protein
MKIKTTDENYAKKIFDDHNMSDYKIKHNENHTCSGFFLNEHECLMTLPECNKKRNEKSNYNIWVRQPLTLLNNYSTEIFKEKKKIIDSVILFVQKEENKTKQDLIKSCITNEKEMKNNFIEQTTVLNEYIDVYTVEDKTEYENLYGSYPKNTKYAFVIKKELISNNVFLYTCEGLHECDYIVIKLNTKNKLNLIGLKSNKIESKSVPYKTMDHQLNSHASTTSPVVKKELFSTNGRYSKYVPEPGMHITQYIHIVQEPNDNRLEEKYNFREDIIKFLVSNKIQFFIFLYNSGAILNIIFKKDGWYKMETKNFTTKTYIFCGVSDCNSEFMFTDYETKKRFRTPIDIFNEIVSNSTKKFRR